MGRLNNDLATWAPHSGRIRQNSARPEGREGEGDLRLT